MALGFCGTCDKLGPIRPGSERWGSRQVAWFPVPHEKPHSHVNCAGVVTFVENDLEDDTTEWEAVCSTCGPVPDSEVSVGTLCDGDKVAIR